MMGSAHTYDVGGAKKVTAEGVEVCELLNHSIYPPYALYNLKLIDGGLDCSCLKYLRPLVTTATCRA